MDEKETDMRVGYARVSSSFIRSKTAGFVCIVKQPLAIVNHLQDDYFVINPTDRKLFRRLFPIF